MPADTGRWAGIRTNELVHLEALNEGGPSGAGNTNLGPDLSTSTDTSGRNWAMSEPTRNTTHRASAGENHGLGSVDRHPKVWRPERTPLPGHLWWGVVHRDDQTCQWCSVKAAPDALEVDHILPHSAGGLDNTTNLRTLCRPCNRNRSNFATYEWKRHLPVVATCQGAHEESSGDRVTVYCLGHRRVESVPDYFAQAYELARTLGREVPNRPADPIAYPIAGPAWLPEMGEI